MKFLFLFLLTGSLSGCLLFDSNSEQDGPLTESRCGDNEIDEGEDCDTDNLLESCQSLGLGDGVLTCFDCSYNATACSGNPICGNGIREAGEDCDDGNRVTESCDYNVSECVVCSSDCEDVKGEVSFCGDAKKDLEEVCDDGDNLGGAVGSCLDCSSVVGCGNGVLDKDEECDDGNIVTEPCYTGENCGCASDCTITEPGFCGDGNQDLEFEDCDDGNSITEVCPYNATDCRVCSEDCALIDGEISFCGDLKVNGNEECDLGQDNKDGCSNACLIIKRVFKTSSLHSGNFGGLSGGDTICQNLADEAQLGGTYKVWASDSTGSPFTRFTKPNSNYRLVNGTLIARS